MSIGRSVASPRGLALDPGHPKSLGPGRLENVLSRVIQVLLCLVGLILLSPVMLLVALAVKVGSRGPV